jgi:hypothetical protein
MIQIIKGNPTPEEVAELVAVLALAGRHPPTRPHLLHGGRVATIRAARPTQSRCTNPA